MVDRGDMLIEIGTEELPPKALRSLSTAFQDGVRRGLDEAGVGAADVVAYASPRRLALWCRSVPTAQADQVVERRGPGLRQAFDEEGRPTRAAEGFARSCGVTVDELETMETDKGAWLCYRSTQPGQATRELVPAIVERSLDALPVPKRMRWGEGEATFVRPVHWVVLLFEDRVVDCSLMEVEAGRYTRGHRFHHPGPLYVAEPAAYAPLLETEGKVLPAFDTRREAIRAQVEEAAVAAGGHALLDEDLLDEVTGLVEWPVAMTGSFDRRFLEVPPEVLIITMQDNQKYFPVVDGDNRLMPYFVAVSNIESRDPAKVREGNERVIRPRFADADFFWQQDRKRPLGERMDALKQVLFQKQLGSLYEKSQRVAAVADAVAGWLGVDRARARRAADLAKCDLVTEMVYEFPELQGTMGRYYAAHSGEAAEVAAAMEEQYLPRQAGDALPATAVGRVLSLADKLDTLVGIFAIGERPTGVKDPFGLRRAALGVLRILIEGELDLDLRALLDRAAEGLIERVDAPAVVPEVLDYTMERLRAYYADQGFHHGAIEAVLARRPTRPYDFDRRVRAVEAFRALPEAESLAAANKRIRNILRKADGHIPEAIDEGLLQQDAEAELYRQLLELSEGVMPMFDQGRYAEALTRLASLRRPLDRFFDDVMVMTEDGALRRNRLALLNRLGGLFLGAADLSRLQQ